MRKLTVKSGPAAGRSMPIEAELVIGRADADLTIEDSELSRRHVLLRPVDGGVEIQDLGSTNGTIVNGTRISVPVTVMGGASIELGDTRIALEVEAEEPVATDGGRRSRLVPVLAALVAVAAIAVAAVLVTGGDSDEAEVRTLSAELTAPSFARPESFQISGAMTGDPLGEVAVIIQRRLAGNLEPGGPAVPVHGFLMVTGPDGVLSLNFQGDVTVNRTGREVLDASGVAANGTQDYEEVRGSFRITGGRPDSDTEVARYRLDGELEY